MRDFVDGGRLAARELDDGLRESGARSFAEVGSVLDFGCGSGRVLPHVAGLASRASCSGCDVDSVAIAWAQGHYPQLDWSVSRFEPPLPFADASFEALYSISVFSHLDERSQDAWLAEVRRVLAPGGVALLSIHGPYAFEQFRSGRVHTRWSSGAVFDRGPLASGEFLFEPYLRSVWNEAELPGVGAAYGLAFHGREYIRRRWSGFLEVADIRERAITAWQDLVVCRRGDGPTLAA